MDEVRFPTSYNYLSTHSCYDKEIHPPGAETGKMMSLNANEMACILLKLLM